MTDVLLLAELRVRLLLRSLVSEMLPRGRPSPLRIALGLGGAIWVVGALLVPAGNLIGSFVQTGQRQNLGAYLGSLIAAVTVLIFVYALVNLMATLTYRSDLDLLMMSPLSPRTVMFDRLLTVASSFSAGMILGLPALIALGRAVHAGTLYYAAALLLVPLIPIVPVSAALLVLLPILRLLPPARARNTATVLGVVLGGMIFVGMQAVWGPGAGDHLQVPDLPTALPLGWPGRGLAALALGDGSGATRWLGGSILISGLFLGAAVVLSARAFALGLATYAEVTRRPRSAARPLPLVLRTAGTLALWGKEWVMLRRDPQRLAQLGYPLIIVGFYAYKLLTSSQRHSLLPQVSLVGIATFTAILLAGAISPTVVAGEGRSLYLLALAPLRPRQIVVAKLAAVAVPAGLLVEVLVVAGAPVVGYRPGEALVVIVGVAIEVVALSGVALAINLIAPRLSGLPGRTNPITSLAGSVTEFVFGALLGGPVGLTVVLWSSMPLWAAVSAAGLTVVASLTVGGSLWLASALMRRLLTDGRAVPRAS